MCKLILYPHLLRSWIFCFEVPGLNSSLILYSVLSSLSLLQLEWSLVYRQTFQNKYFDYSIINFQHFYMFLTDLVMADLFGRGIVRGHHTRWKFSLVPHNPRIILIRLDMVVAWTDCMQFTFPFIFSENQYAYPEYSVLIAWYKNKQSEIRLRSSSGETQSLIRIHQIVFNWKNRDIN